MTDKLLQVNGLHKSFQKGSTILHVLRGVDFLVDTGDMVSIIGKSGSGKSTLLHLLGTLDAPDQGQIFFKGKNLVDYSSTELADFRNRTIGFVFQFHHLLPQFSAIENAMMPGLIRRMPRNDVYRMAEKVLAEVGLADRLHHRPGELSGGEQQRVALARALLMDPPLLLTDEVTGNLDERTGEGIHQLLFDLNHQRQVTLLVVTHNLSLADRMPRRMLLEEGILKERA